MYLGDRGPEVIEIQRRLIDMGYLDRLEDGYGPITKRAVIRLQESKGQEPTGVYDDSLFQMNMMRSIPVMMSDGGGGGVSKSGSNLKLLDNSLLPRKRGGGVTVDPIACYIINLLTGTTVEFDMTPEEIPESLAANFDGITPRGRSGPIYGYSGSGPSTVNFDVELSADYCRAGLVETVNKLKAMVFPEYGAYVKSPSCMVRVGNFIFFKGVITGVDVVWKKPYKEGIYTLADVSLSFNRVEEFTRTASEVEGGD